MLAHDQGPAGGGAGEKIVFLKMDRGRKRERGGGKRARPREGAASIDSTGLEIEGSRLDWAKAPPNPLDPDPQSLSSLSAHLFRPPTSSAHPPPRNTQKNGVHYHFVPKEDFLAGVSAGHFLEHASVHGNCYGTSRAAVERVAADGRCCVLDIDVQGARSVKASGLPAVFAFVAPPSLGELEARLRGRGTEDGAAVERRLAAARGEIESLNDDPGLWDFVIVNDDFAEASAQLGSVARRALAGCTGNGTRSSNGAEPGREKAAAEGEERGGEVAREEVMTPNGTTSLAAFAASNGAAAAAAGRVLGSSSSDGGAAAASAPGKAAAVAAAAAPCPSPSSSSSRSWPLGYSPSTCLEGRVVAVTGASAGIGRALCLQLAALPNVRVVGLARRGDRLEGLADEIRKRHESERAASTSAASSPPSPEFLPVICDVTREGEVAALPRIVRARWGDAAGVDVLINNAGMSRHDSALLDGNPASWAAMLNVNVLAPALLTRVFVADLRERIAKAAAKAESEEAAATSKERGDKKATSSTGAPPAAAGGASSVPSHARPAHVVNVSSMMAHRVYVYPGCGGLYSATKHALRAMTEGLRLEARAAGLPLRVSLVSPGRVATEFLSAMHDGAPPRPFPPAVDGSPGPSPAMSPEDVAGAVLFVLAAPPGVDVNDVLMRPAGQTV